MKYLFYILKHKYYFFLEAIKMKLFWSAITHDWSKFLPSEFKAHNKYFYSSKRNRRMIQNFMTSYRRHIKHNEHHWQFWIADNYAYPMPERYIKEMICDWRAMGRDGKQPSVKYYEENKKSMFLHEKTKELIEKLLYK